MGSTTKNATSTGAQLIAAREGSLGARPHSMEQVAVLAEVVYINDSKSTYLDATLDSLGLLEARVIWIAGMSTSDLGEGHIQELLEERVTAVVRFGSSADQEGADLRPFKGPLYHAGDLRTAVFLARELAKPGEVVLFSPACPSGQGFANYEERGAAFRQAVRDL
jgi:UDP-N-acetylmuramoylalanine--D-glutamate ligase